MREKGRDEGIGCEMKEKGERELTELFHKCNEPGEIGWKVFGKISAHMIEKARKEACGAL